MQGSSGKSGILDTPFTVSQWEESRSIIFFLWVTLQGSNSQQSLVCMFTPCPGEGGHPEWQSLQNLKCLPLHIKKESGYWVDNKTAVHRRTSKVTLFLTHFRKDRQLLRVETRCRVTVQHDSCCPVSMHLLIANIILRIRRKESILFSPKSPLHMIILNLYEQSSNMHPGPLV